MNVSQLRSRTQTLVQTQLSARIRNPLARSPRSTERALGRPRSLRVHSVGDFFQRVAVTAKRAMSATPWTAPDFYTSERWWTKDTIAVVRALQRTFVEKAVVFPLFSKEKTPKGENGSKQTYQLLMPLSSCFLRR